ncbi:MAG: DUF202 domain-containing protein [Bdellovibrionaceae bacterium]|nr:DUF202 domain-containing protein [Pseudobdellovibrionaceae bacterium]MBX3033987.1 DUF202 domain-containing protein [Pseudobdellovibrionaceae bacterium]
MEFDPTHERPDPEKIVHGRTGDAASTTLSEFRTGLSEHRTDLSEHRTGLSEHRTQLSDIRSHLSNERTHLSYLRTGISLISFGITLNRFSLFLIQENLSSQVGHTLFLHDAKNVGFGMVVLGSLLLFWSMIRFVRTTKAIDELRFQPSKWSILGFTTVVAVMGTIATIWLFRS